MLYKKNGAVSCVGSDFISNWALYLARTWLVVVQFARNENYTWIPSWTGFYCGQISIETATHSLYWV